MATETMYATVALPYLKASYGSNLGHTRDSNEDNVLVIAWPDQAALLCVVADGMGGHNGGETASRIVTEVFRELISYPLPSTQVARYEMLMDQFGKADEAVRDRAALDTRLRGMGSTVVAAIVTPQECLHLYAGDCRLYHFREGKQLHVTADHSVIRLLLEMGQITPAEVDQHPMRSIVTSAIGGNSNNQLLVSPPLNSVTDMDTLEHTSKATLSDQQPFLQLEAGDVLIMCSDGLCGEIEQSELQRLVEQSSTEPHALVHSSIVAALQAGGQDNISVIVVCVADAGNPRFPE
ncbi:MAG: serine/threonine-protein phosphatase [Abitibacteriaceae bacterium]|nr:serine/threonine-protein phosphatase [Abditibacteriaceae bacterium]